MTTTATKPYRLNETSETHWEIVGPGGTVAQFIEKTADDDNRGAAVRRVRELNRKHAEAPDAR